MKNIFEIKQIELKHAEDTVLDIAGLEIPHGLMTMFLGKSGIGKTTLLETLGLMRDTLVRKKNIDESFIKYFPHIDKVESKYSDIKSLWNYGDNRLEFFRKNYFGFVFQSNNLVPGFSIIENIVLPVMIKDKAQDYEVIKLLAEEAISILFADELAPSQISKFSNKSVNCLSTGQRQRISFARVLVANKDVVFADEPTGNLDERNAENLLKLLSPTIEIENINAIKSPCSSIVVTHNKYHALEFADRIVLISENERKIGEIKESDIYDRDKNDRELFIRKSDSESFTLDSMQKAIEDVY